MARTNTSLKNPVEIFHSGTKAKVVVAASAVPHWEKSGWEVTEKEAVDAATTTQDSQESAPVEQPPKVEKPKPSTK